MDQVLGITAGILSFVLLETLVWFGSRQRCHQRGRDDFSELVSRVTEIIASALLVCSGMWVAWIYVANNLNDITASFPAARWHCGLMLSFFLYHSARVWAIKGYLRSLLVHHGLMVFGLSYCLFADIFYFYPAIISLQSLAAILRNYGWLSQRLEAWPILPRALKKSAYILIENVLTLAYLIYFLGWGMHIAEIPWHGWAVGFSIAMILLGLTLYWTLQFLQNGGAASRAISGVGHSRKKSAA